MRGALAGVVAVVAGCSLIDLSGLQSDGGTEASVEASTEAGADVVEGGPVQLVHARAFGITLDDAGVYYTDFVDQVVARMDKDGSNQVTLANGLLATGLGPESIVVDDVNVYWGSGFGVHQCAKAGCSNAPTHLIDENIDSGVTYFPNVVAVDASYVYFVNQDTVVSVLKVPKGVAEGPVSVVTSSSMLSCALNGVKLGGGYLYVACDDGTIKRVALPTGSVETLTGMNPPLRPGALVTNAGTVFYGQLIGYGTTVYSMPIQQGAMSTPIALSQPWVTSLAVDNTQLYWLSQGAAPDNGTGYLASCDVATCSTVQQRAAYLDEPQNIALDDTWIFWTANGNGTTAHVGVWRLAK